MEIARIDARDVVEAACAKLGYNLSRLIALASIWVNPKVVELLAPLDGVWYPNRRRANEGLRIDGKRVESVGDVIDGISLDNNTYANNCFKIALGIPRRQFVGFSVCHIWAGTAYDAQHFTQIANLVAIPSELASLSDHHHHVAACLKYRSWELYGWKPQKELAPVKPADYPIKWRDPFRFNDFARKAVMRRLGINAITETEEISEAPARIPVPPIPDDTFIQILTNKGFEEIVRVGKRSYVANRNGRSYRFSFRVSSYSLKRNDWSFTFYDVADNFKETSHLIGLMRSQADPSRLRDQVLIISPSEIQQQFQNRATWFRKLECNRYDVKIGNTPNDEWQTWLKEMDKID